jgi:hypothetical protein
MQVGPRSAFNDPAALPEEGTWMDKLVIERRGGFAGLKAKSEIDAAALDAPARAALDALFAAKKKFPAAKGADRYVYTLTRGTGAEAKTVEVPEHLVPPAVARSVKDKLP